MTEQLQLDQRMAQTSVKSAQSADLEARLRKLLPSLDETDRELVRLLWGATPVVSGQWSVASEPTTDHRSPDNCQNAIPLSAVAHALKLPWITATERERTAREIKARVKDLIEFRGVPIGSSRGGKSAAGYFLILTAADHARAIQPLVGELTSLARRIRALSGKRELARLWGQIALDLERKSSSPQRTQGAA